MHFTWILVPLVALVASSPIPSPHDSTGGSGYTGNGGQANGGGNIKNTAGLLNLDILNLGSGNSGNAGSANSGNSFGGGAGAGTGCGGGKGGDAYTDHARSKTVVTGEEAEMTGVGGQANGGENIKNTFGLINIDALNLDSYNSGDAGSANSGAAYGGQAAGGACVA